LPTMHLRSRLRESDECECCFDESHGDMLSPNEFEYQPCGADTVKNWFSVRGMRSSQVSAWSARRQLRSIGANGWG